jgi:hypothetical protein
MNETVVVENNLNASAGYAMRNSSAQKLSIDVPSSTIALSICMYSIIFLIGFFGNSLVILVAYCNRAQQHSTHYCLVNLSIADLLLIIVCMPSAVLDLFSKEVWYLGEVLCNLSFFFLSILQCAERE